MENLERRPLDRERLDARSEQIREVYLSDQRPWVIGYSGGKDSTTALQLIWYALRDLSEDKRAKPVYVISSDTLVETPKIVEYIDTSLERIDRSSREQRLPFSAHKVSPKIEDSFWVNLIGRGYPAPSPRFRWCTERLKIDPANAFIMERAAEFGEVVMILGVRRDESATRAQVMSLHRIKNSLLSRHTTLPSAFVYTPIEDFSVDDVWSYLLQVPSPWGNRNRDLVTLYRNAQAGECPLVVDDKTPSCGNSRFGCWVCTVVTKDKSMEALIENGEDWLEPLLEYRDLLASTKDPAVKRQVRQPKRRDGQVMMKKGGGLIMGPYKLTFRKELLRRLLETQKLVQRDGPDPDHRLIDPIELQLIRQIWRTEAQDWEDSVPKIYREVMGEDLAWIEDEQPRLSTHDRDLLDAVCARHDVSSAMVAKLLDVERELNGMSRRTAVYQRITDVMNEDWRSEAEIFAQEEAAEG